MDATSRMSGNAPSREQTTIPRWLSLLALLTGSALTSGTAQAQGREFAITRHDLRLVIDTRWVGCRSGGYYPIRIRATNVGPARNLTFLFRSDTTSQGSPAVERTIGLEQNATVQFALSVPLVSPGSYGTLSIREGGVPLSGLEWSTQLSDSNNYEPIQPALLALSASPVDLTQFERAAQVLYSSSSSGYGGALRGWAPGMATFSPSTATGNSLVLGPTQTMLPDSWIDYSGLDVVTSTLESFEALPRGPRAAILRWIEAGGTLILYDVGGPPDKSEALQKVLGLAGRASSASSWKTSRSTEFRPGDAQKLTLQARIKSESGGEAPNALIDELFEGRWGDSTTFAIHDLMQGRVVALEGDLFSGKAGDWQGLLSAVGKERLLWPNRHGFSSRAVSEEFLQFEIPGLHGVPVRVFLTMITLFAVTIGPVNYFILWKKKQLWLLTVTIPLIAFFTSVSLFAWSTISHGFSVKTRTRSLTELDQKAHTAVTTARVSLFAGLAPSGGLKYSPETAVYPVWQPGGDPFRSGRVDWTSTQALESGWLRSRTRTQFVTETHRSERGRLVLKPVEAGMLPVENGFEWNAFAVAVSDDQQDLYVGAELKSGAATKLRRAERTEDVQELLTLLARYPLQLPEGANNAYRTYSYGRPYPQYPVTPVSFTSGLMEQKLASITNAIHSERKLPPRTFVMILEDNPGIEKGVAEPNEQAPLHVLIGHY